MKSPRREARAMTERRANEWAAAVGQPFQPGALEEEIFQRHLEFRKICRKVQKQHYL